MEARFNALLFALIVCFNYVNSQEMKSDKGDWIFTSQIGFASLEAEDLFKTSANVVENAIGKEIIIAERASIVLSIEHLDIRADYVDDGGNQIFLKNLHFTIPITFQLSTDLERPISFLTGLGVYSSFLHRSETENVVDHVIRKQKGAGWNFGLQLYFDTQFKLNEKLRFIVGIKTKADAFKSYKSAVQNFIITDFHALRFGLKWHPKG